MQENKSVQTKFNEVKGVIYEFIDGEKFCSVTISVGHDNTRDVNLTMKKPLFDEVRSKHALGDKVFCSFYPVSNFKNGRYYNALILLSIELA